jgi:hypothetical protein
VSKAMASGKSKYRNVKVTVDGVTFDSKKEMRRYGDLMLAVLAGEITNLRRQVRYDLHAVGGAKIATYVADHVYDQNDATVVEDVKSDMTRKLPMYRLKKKWMKLEYGITISEYTA